MKRYIVAALALLAVPAIAAEVQDWNAVDNSNVDIAPENMSPALVNDAIRAVQGATARWSGDESCVIASAGSSSVWTLSATRTLTSYYDGLKVCFDAHTDNDGTVTLNVDSLGAVTIKKESDENLSAGDIQTGMKVEAVFDGTNFQLLSPTTTSSLGDLITTRGDLIYGDSGAAAARLALGSSGQVLASDGTDAAWSDIALPRSYLAGMGLTVGTDADHDIDIAAGESRDAANSANITLAAITKRIDATWSAGTGNGGLSSSLTAPANDTWYHVFAIIVGGTADVGFDTSITAANLVSDHTATAYRRLGSVLTDGSANIIAFVQYGDKFLWVDPPLDVSTASPGTSANTVTLTVPTGVVVQADVNVRANANLWYLSPLTVNDEAPSGTAAPLAQSGTSTATNNTDNVQVFTNTSAQIRYRVTTNSQVYMATLGWTDTRGRDD